VQILLCHFGFQNCTFLDVDAATLELIPGLECFLTGTKLGKAYDLLSGWLATQPLSHLKMRRLIQRNGKRRPGGRWAISSVINHNASLIDGDDVIRIVGTGA